MDRPLHPDDIVEKKSNPHHVGVVERTHTDVDTHHPYPQRGEPDDIRPHGSISAVAFKKFKRDGVPPKNTVLVRWQHSLSAWLVPCSELKLLDRSLLIGDIVRRDSKDAMSGVVITTLTTCSLQPICDVTYKEKYQLKGLLPPGPLATGFERPRGPAAPAPVFSVPASELRESEDVNEEDLVIYKDWIGRVTSMVRNIVLKLADNCVVEIPEEKAEHADDAIDTFAVGDIAKTTKANLRTGNWIYGAYNPNTPPSGTVVKIRPLAVEIAWLQRRIGGMNAAEPPAALERRELESDFFSVYDRTRRPKLSTFTNNPTTETVSNSEIDVRLGVRVRFKDIAGACVKYDGSSVQGKVPRIARGESLGYDLNVFDVTRFQTDVTVQWQDLTITKEASVDLVPDSSIDDENAAWPGEIAHTLDVAPVPDMPSIEQPSRVGVIQAVNAEARMAKITWAPNATVQYSVDAEAETGLKPLVTGVVGVASGATEEVSLYDIEPPAAMNVRRGDIVLVAKKRWLDQADAQPIPGADWLGEIVDTCLDGTLTIRLGAAAEVRDVQLCREDVVVAIRSDATGETDEWDDDEVDDEFMGMLDEHPEMLGDGTGAVAVWRGQGDDDDDFDDWEDDNEEDEFSDDSSEDEPIARYEDENGNVLDEDDVEDGDWESDDDEDLVMVDAASEQTPPTSTSATPPATGKDKEDAANTTAAAAPPQYLILDTLPPPTHHYATSPTSTNSTHLKRVQKEHRILQKPSALPTGVYIRTYESRLDLLRALIIGPAETPYAHAPFLIDLHLPPAFPTEPPQAFFHSWPGENGLGGTGRVNPNLYEDGKICLSLLGTWEGSKGEGWNAGRSTVLQVLVSLLGLVLVREPYFNEAGYEHLVGLEGSRRPSALYSERTFLRARGFAVLALGRLGKAVEEGGGEARGLEGVEDALRWEYWARDGPRLLEKVVKDVEDVLEKSAKGGWESDGLTVMSQGACVPLRRVLERLRQLQ